jgi:hypothetical protein
MEPSQAAPSIDELAEELTTAVNRAVAANADAALSAAYTSMSDEVETAASAIDAANSVLHGGGELALEQQEREDLETKQDTLAQRLEAVRSQFTRDPVALRRGSVFRDAKTAFDALQSALETHRDASYQRLLASYADNDRQQLGTLPPSTPGIDDYRRAIDRFQQALQRPPTSPAELTQAIKAGERLRELRAKTEQDAVPAEHRSSWRRLLGPGLPLDELTEDFAQWLRSRGLEDAVVLHLTPDGP